VFVIPVFLSGIETAAPVHSLLPKQALLLEKDEKLIRPPKSRIVEFISI